MKKQKKKMGPRDLILPAFLFIAALVPGMRFQLFGIAAVVIAVICFVLAFGKGRKKAEERRNPAPFRPVSPGAGKPCPNPENHRHYEVQKPCPNPESHKHYGGSAPSRPLTQFEQDEAARKKRLENMRVLYDAGLLTREEYDYEVRRLRNL